MNVDPSNSAHDAMPKDKSASAPDIRSMRSDSITPLAAWVFCRGTIVNCDMLEEPSRLVPRDYEALLLASLTTKNKIIPRFVQFMPFQNSKNDEDPSVDLVQGKMDECRCPVDTYRPAAKMLLPFPLSTSTAVTGPGISELEPIAVQLVFENVYCATFAAVLSDNAIEPKAMSCSSLF
jgi:hypothetical protein